MRCCMVRQPIRLSTLTPRVRPITLGIVVTLFFKCMGALISPANNMRRSVKWGLAAHITALFVLLSIQVTMDLHAGSIEFVDGRDFPGTDKIPPGPIGCYIILGSSAAFRTLYKAIFPLNQWLADGPLVSFTLHSAARVPYMVCSSSCIVVISSIL